MAIAADKGTDTTLRQGKWPVFSRALPQPRTIQLSGQRD